jgi:hypothetical protein
MISVLGDPIFYIRFLLCVLAAFRLAHLIALERGPFAIFEKVRKVISDKWGFDSWQSDGSNCVLCQSVWYSTLFVVLMWVLPEPILTVFVIGLVCLAVAAMVLIIYVTLYKNS